MSPLVLRIAIFAGVATLCAACATAPGPGRAEQEQLVNRAETTLSHFQQDPQMRWFQANVHRARAIIIVPEAVRAGFVFGGSGGRGVVLAREEKTRRWVGPAFYTLATASVGFQAGVSVSEVVMLVMTESAMNRMLGTSLKLGADASIAAGPVGIGAEASVTADVIAFSRSVGLYGGLNVDGSLLDVSEDWSQRYYGARVSPVDILIRHSVRNAQADNLLRRMSAVAGK